MPRAEPERTCIVSRSVRPPGEMIRFVVGPGGAVTPDLKERLPGRGAWVTANAEAVRTAVKRRLFARAFKAEVTASPALAEEIEAALRADLRQALSLANKAGAVVAGFAKVEAAAEKGLAALLHAREAAADGRRKLGQALRRRLGEAIWGVPVIDEFAGDELEMALGRPHVIHAALVASAGSEGFLARWRRLRDFRGTMDDGTGLAGEPEAVGLRQSTSGSEAE